MPGYSLDQLLDWCKTDRLIEGYVKQGDSITFWRDTKKYVLPNKEACSYLKHLYAARAGENKTLTPEDE